MNWITAPTNWASKHESTINIIKLSIICHAMCWCNIVMTKEWIVNLNQYGKPNFCKELIHVKKKIDFSTNQEARLTSNVQDHTGQITCNSSLSNNRIQWRKHELNWLISLSFYMQVSITFYTRAFKKQEECYFLPV